VPFGVLFGITCTVGGHIYQVGEKSSFAKKMKLAGKIKQRKSEFKTNTLKLVNCHLTNIARFDFTVAYTIVVNDTIVAFWHNGLLETCANLFFFHVLPCIPCITTMVHMLF